MRCSGPKVSTMAAECMVCMGATPGRWKSHCRRAICKTSCAKDRKGHRQSSPGVEKGSPAFLAEGPFAGGPCGHRVAARTVASRISSKCSMPKTPSPIGIGFVFTVIMEGSGSYLSSPCLSTIIGGIWGLVRAKRRILGVMY